MTAQNIDDDHLWISETYTASPELFKKEGIPLPPLKAFTQFPLYCAENNLSDTVNKIPCKCYTHPICSWIITHLSPQHILSVKDICVAIISVQEVLNNNLITVDILMEEWRHSKLKEAYGS